jgi:hypothetical protein
MTEADLCKYFDRRKIGGKGREKGRIKKMRILLAILSKLV